MNQHPGCVKPLNSAAQRCDFGIWRQSGGFRVHRADSCIPGDLFDVRRRSEPAQNVRPNGTPGIGWRVARPDKAAEFGGCQHHAQSVWQPVDTDDRIAIFGGAVNRFIKPRHPAKGDERVLHFHRDEMTAMKGQNAVALDVVTEGIRCHNSPFPVRPSRGTRCQPRDAIRKLDEDLKLFLRRNIEQTGIYIQRLFRIGFREQ